MTIPAGPPATPAAGAGTTSTRYLLGEVVHLSTEVTVGGTPVDPASAVLRLQLPDGTVTDYTETDDVTHPDTGVFELEYPLSLDGQTGQYRWAWITTGTGAGIASGAFVAVDPFAPALLTLPDAKAQLGKSARTVNDDELQWYVDTATEQIEKRCGPVAPRTVTVTATISNGSLWLPVTPVTGLVSGASGGVPFDVAGWSVDSIGRLTSPSGGRWWSTAAPTFTVRVGRDPIPASLQLAARMLVQHLWETQRAQSAAPQQGGFGEMPTPGYGFAWPNRVSELIRPYELPPAVA